MDNEKGIVRFENTTNLSGTQVFDFNRTFLKPLFIKLGILLPVMFGLFAIYCFTSLDSMVFGFIMIGLGVVVVALMPFLYMATLKKNSNENKFCSSTTFVEYSFEDGGVRTKTRKGDVEISTMAIDYRNVIKLVETNKYLYIFITNNMSYILDKNGMTEGKIDELIEFLKGKIGCYKKLKK